MNRIISTAALAVALAASSFATMAALAQTRHPAGAYFDPSRGEAPPVVIRKQLPFTDSGTSAPQYYENHYVYDQTEGNIPVYSSFRPDVLPGRFGEIGRGTF